MDHGRYISAICDSHINEITWVHSDVLQHNTWSIRFHISVSPNCEDPDDEITVQFIVKGWKYKATSGEFELRTSLQTECHYFSECANNTAAHGLYCDRFCMYNFLL